MTSPVESLPAEPDGPPDDLTPRRAHTRRKLRRSTRPELVRDAPGHELVDG